MAIDLQAIGRTSTPGRVVWTAKDTMLYAVSVGVGGDDPTRNLQYTTENTGNVVLEALPTMCVVLDGGVPFPDFGDFDGSKLLHARQSIAFHRPLPVEGEAIVVRSIEDLFDKGGAAIVVMKTELTAPDGAPICSVRSHAFIRGAGGFGGKRASPVSWDAPERAPDFSFTQKTQPNQALIYRLNSDRNPLHTDPAFARRGGLEKPILHGLCTFGFVAQGLPDHTAFKGATWKRISARFSASVLPGDELTTTGWVDGHTVRFRTSVGKRSVLDQGILEVAA